LIAAVDCSASEAEPSRWDPLLLFVFFFVEPFFFFAADALPAMAFLAVVRVRGMMVMMVRMDLDNQALGYQ